MSIMSPAAAMSPSNDSTWDTAWRNTPFLWLQATL